MWVRAVLAVVLGVVIGCVGSIAAYYRVPAQPPMMLLHTPEGYDLQFWIFEEYDESCVFEYSVLGRNHELLAHGKNPCELLIYYFHAIQKRPPEV
jgi:hypothetical protein